MLVIEVYQNKLWGFETLNIFADVYFVYVSQMYFDFS